jgi:hypothetical protein
MGMAWTEMAGGAPAHPGLKPGPIPGSWQVGGPDAPVIAAIGFRDRSEALGLAIRSSQPAQVALAHLRAMALRREGHSDQQALDLAILDLAGAEAEDSLPGFAETALCVARGTGLGLSEIGAAPAAEIDAMARVLLQASEGDGATRIVFAAAAASDVAGQIEARLHVLLRRAVARPAEASIAASVPAPASLPMAPAAAENAAWAEPASHRTEPTLLPPPGEQRQAEAATVAPRPFRLAPIARAVRAAPAQPVPLRAWVLPAAQTGAAPAASATAAPDQPLGRRALSLVPAAETAETASALPMDRPSSPSAGRPLIMPGELARRYAGVSALAPALAHERVLSPSQEPPLLAALRLPDLPPTPDAPRASSAVDEVVAAAPAAASPWPAGPPETVVFANILAAALEDEADLRGVAL